MSYALNGRTHKKHFYHSASQLKYFQVTSESIFKIDFIKDLCSAILFQHSSFHAFTQSYNYRYCLNQAKRDRLNAKRVADIFFIFHIAKYYLEYTKGELIG